jgi:rubredoxin
MSEDDAYLDRAFPEINLIESGSLAKLREHYEELNRDFVALGQNYVRVGEKLACKVCGHVYEPAKDGAYEKLPSTWVCPGCGVSKSCEVEEDSILQLDVLSNGRIIEAKGVGIKSTHLWLILRNRLLDRLAAGEGTPFTRDLSILLKTSSRPTFETFREQFEVRFAGIHRLPFKSSVAVTLQDVKKMLAMFGESHVYVDDVLGRRVDLERFLAKQQFRPVDSPDPPTDFCGINISMEEGTLKMARK